MRELILYVVQRSQDDLQMGATKLNKVLFRCDFGAYLHLGEAITGHPYFKLKNGPAPRHLVDIRQGMVADGLVRIAKIEVGADKPMDRWEALRSPDLSSFTREQLAFVDGVIEAMSDQTGTRAADDTHLMVGWRLASIKQDIPYETAFLADRASPSDINRGRQLAREHGWA
jgi:hypothetical protein